jgi:predicted nucleotidyltransferase
VSAGEPRAPAAAAARRAPDPEVLAEVVRRIVAVAQPERIILFGSAARGEMGPDSDIDLLVVKSGVEHRRRLEALIHRSLFGVTTPVDVVVVTPDDVARFGQRVGSIIRPALRDGREAVAHATAVVRWAESLVAAADA